MAFFPDDMTEEEKKRAQSQLWLDLGSRLMAASGPQPYKQGLASMVGKAGLGTMGQYNDIIDRARQEQDRQQTRQLNDLKIQAAQQQLNQQKSAQGLGGQVADYLTQGTTNVPSNIPGLYNPGATPPEPSLARIAAAQTAKTGDISGALGIMEPNRGKTAVLGEGDKLVNYLGDVIAQGNPKAVKPETYKVIEGDGLQWYSQGPGKPLKAVRDMNGKQLAAKKGAGDDIAYKRYMLAKDNAAVADLKALYGFTEFAGIKDKKQTPYFNQAMSEIRQLAADPTTDASQVAAKVFRKQQVNYVTDDHLARMKKNEEEPKKIQEYQKNADSVRSLLDQGVSAEKIKQMLKDLKLNPRDYGL